MLIRDLQAEVARELSLRAVVFPKLVEAGRLTEHEACDRNDRLRAVLQVLTRLVKLGITQSDQLHKEPSILRDPNTPVQVPPSTSIIKGGAQ